MERSRQIDTTLNCTLAADIDMTDIEWTPVGNDTIRYNGTFEGGDHTITGLTINQSGSSNVGLIGYLDTLGKVQNLTLDNASITGRQYVGGVVGYNNNGTVTNCSVLGSVNGNGGTNVGGVVGENYGIVTACSVSGSVTGYQRIGGVVGTNSGTVTACYHASGGVSSTAYYVGGVVGQNSGTVTACYHASGSVTGNGYVGGVVGSNNGTETACYYSYDEGDGCYDQDVRDTTWSDAVDGMNQGIENWNTSNSDKYCYWKYVLTGDLPTLTKTN